MLIRKVEKEINDWIANDKRALLVTGVRQAGKTYIIRKCLEENGCDYVEFNLIEEPEVAEIMRNSTGTDDLVLKLSLYSSKEIKEGKTFIFFDEIQKYKEIVTRVKFLTEDNRFRYVMSGSLLGVELNNLRSAPVGYLRTIKMYPLDFEEFIQIFSVPSEVIAGIREAFRECRPVDESIHKKMTELFDLYLIIGGMPQAVEAYRETNNIDRVIDIHKDLTEQYKLDFTQYEAENRKLIISNIYELIPAELNEQNKRFKIADIDKNLRYERINDSFIWLWKAGVALPAFNISQPVTPLMINQKSTLFKLFLSDTGMLTSIYGKATKLKILSRAKDVTKGAVYENAVAQELTAHGYPLYYYNSKKFGEIDFVIEDGENVLPVEVKSGKDYKKHSALDNISKNDDYPIKRSIVLADTNVRIDESVIYMPLYMVMAIQKDETDFTDISADRYMWQIRPEERGER